MQAAEVGEESGWDVCLAEAESCCLPQPWGGGGGGGGGVFEYSIIAMARPVQGQAKTGLVRPWTGRGDTFKGLSHASICRSSYSLTQSHARPLGSFLARDG